MSSPEGGDQWVRQGFKERPMERGHDGKATRSGDTEVRGYEGASDEA